MTKLYLDDIRVPEDSSWIIVRNYQEFRDYIDNNPMPDTISFDHDLATEHYAPRKEWENYNQWAARQNFREKTGLDCAKYIGHICFTKKIPFPECNVHSMNPVGGRNIADYLRTAMLYGGDPDPKVTLEKLPCTING